MRQSSLLSYLCIGIAIAAGVVACGSSDDDSSGTAGSAGSPGAGGSAGQAGASTITQARSDKPRESSPSLTGDEMTQLAAGNAAFATDLYAALRGNAGNFIYSPHSTSIALAMTYAGARGTSEQQMAATLHFTLPQDKLHQAFNQLDLELQKRNNVADPAKGKGFRLNVANSLWGQNDTPFIQTFLDGLAVNYGAGMNLVDFIGNAEGARVAINDWVADKTEDKIKDLLPKGAVDGNSRLVLTNAIYFNASWRHAFQEGLTADASFHTKDEGDVTVKMMHDGGLMRYAKGTDWEAVELPYEGGMTSMTIVLPQPGMLDSVEAQLSSAWLTQLSSAKGNVVVNLSLPRFSFESRFGLKGTLTAMGMADPFSDAADFSGMLDPKVEPLQITDVIHKAFIGIDEKGTEAAAATAVVVGADGGIGPTPPTPVEFIADRPFLFLIHDNPTGAILFAGRVVNPTVK